MATDYDAPHNNDADGLESSSLEELQAGRGESQAGSAEIDEVDTAESYELPGADLSDEELTVRVVPKQKDEFTCGVCFLVQHISRLAYIDEDGTMVCQDCAG